MIDYTKPIQSLRADVTMTITAINTEEGSAVGYVTDKTGYHYPLLFNPDGTVTGPGIPYSVASTLRVIQYDLLEVFRNLPTNSVVWIKMSTGNYYTPRHFSRVDEKGYIYTFIDGCTSYTTKKEVAWPIDKVFLTEPAKDIL